MNDDELIRRLSGIAPDGSLSKVSKLPNGTYTIQNRKSGDHRTIRIRRQSPEARFAPGKRVMSILTGPNNRTDYTGVAFVDENGVVVWKRYRDTDLGKTASFVWKLVVNGEHADLYEVLHEGRCHICNRKLTEPESIRTGIGPVCAERAVEEAGLDPRVLKVYRLQAKLEDRI